MQLAPQETIDALAGAVWLPVLSVEPEGSAICQCIRTTHPSGLYITRDGIITHNSSPQETNARGKSDPVPQSILRSQPDRILAALAKEDEIFRYPKTAATSIEEALRDINPGIIFLGDATRPDERQESTADRRLLFKTELGREFYVYEREDRGGDVWIDVSRLEEGEQGGAIYAAIGDYAANTRRTFVGDPAGLSEAALIRRTSHMISLALRHGTTAHIKPSPEQLQGRPEKGIAGFEWKGNDESRFHALVNSFLATVANRYPGTTKARYDFESGQFLDRGGLPIHREGDRSFDTAGNSEQGRAARAGKRTLSRAIFLKSLLEESASGQGRSEVLERFLSRRNSLKKIGLHELFSQSAPIAPERMAKLDEYEARASAEVDGNRTVGDPRLSFSTASTQWMAFDELRKHEFERQLERDWRAVAERMLRDDPAGVREALLDAAAEGKILTPIQTKAAQLLIAAESALPRTPERRAAIYQLIEAYRATGAEASRSLSARQDPYATPLQRWKAFFAEQIYTPPARIRRLMDGALWERQRDAQIARLRKVIADAANTSTAAASQAREEIKRLEEARTKEALMRVDYETRVKKIESALAKMGVTLDDIFDGEIKLSLMGAEVVKHTASAVHGRDRAILRDLQGKHGGNISDIAKRHKVSRKEVLAIQKEFEANLREKFLEKARRGIREDELETEGISDALLSQTERKIPTEEEAQKIADRMMRMAGFFGKDHDRMKIRKPRKEKPAKEWEVDEKESPAAKNRHPKGSQG